MQRECVYKAIEFGRRARIPNPGDVVLRDRYGDCKDQALLLVQMLNAAGVPAHLALTDTNGPLERDLPSLDQFDHMVVYVPGVRGGATLDVTDKSSPVSRRTPLHAWDQDILVLDPAAPRIVALPAFVEDPSRIGSRRTVELAADGEATVSETLRLEGFHAATMRAWLAAATAQERPGKVGTWLGEWGVRPEQVEITGLDDPADPVVLTWRYRAPERWHPVEGRLAGTVPAVLERDYLELGAAPPRRSPFRRPVPLSFTSAVTVQLPTGWRAAVPPAAEGKTQFAAWQFQATAAAPNALHLTYACHTATGEFPAARHDELRAALDEALRPWRQPVVLTRDADAP